MLKREEKPYWNLSVTVLHGNIKTSYDYWSESDCYVILNLPTASARTYRTKTVANSNKPVWNETFHFRVQSNVKNILELQIYDNDPYMRDDQITTVLFDIDNLTLEKKEKKCFILNDTKKDELWVEFEITNSSEVPSPIMTNGVLVAGPFCELKVGVDKLPHTEAIQNIVLKLKGAFKEDQVILIEDNPKTLHFYINGNLETELFLTPESRMLFENFVQTETNQVDGANPKYEDIGSSIAFKPLPAKQQITVSLPLGLEKIDVELNIDDCVAKDLDVRLGFDIPTEENNFLVKRRKVVSQALQRALHLISPPEPSKVPVVAVVCSGGGSRAMTGTYGSLRGLQKLQLLDAVTYITGVSGSTWALSTLYGDPNWSKTDMVKIIESAKKEISKSTFSIFSLEQLGYYREKMKEKEKEGHLVSLIDMWGLAIEYLIQGKNPMGTLSEMQKTLSEGQNPLPIFTVVNMKDGKTECTTEAEWCEFTPYEVGISKYGAFVPAQNFGSGYYLGHMVKKLPETRLSFLLGIWSSVFSLNLTEIWGLTTGIAPSWAPGTGREASDKSEDTAKKEKSPGTSMVSPVTDTAKMLSGFMNSRPIISQMLNFLRGLQLHRDYNENSGFITGKEKHPDAFPNTLTPVDPMLSLVDAGFSINTGFPPVVGSQRHADVIISLNYSWDQDQFMVLKQTHKYCSDRKIPFPKIDFQKLESVPLKEVYVFEDEENQEAPIVIHFPLVNVTFKQFKAPGVKRVTEKELKEGAVDVEFKSDSSPYVTHKITYTPEDFDKLVNLTSYNIINNKDVILKVLKKAVNRKSK
ncbi:cytosolic phospholipase A2 zeta-like [Triplophysa dalaica]|uniref:cytosolic phospholipase A2 zeta-like n=1 Tax=Triplophysa dalaica TaxID=1582913 RepID=UPI0024DF5701|nr:cytosolic phospholipase A2 zeta-like [Triplophysa dalaica]